MSGSAPTFRAVTFMSVTPYQGAVVAVVYVLLELHGNIGFVHARHVTEVNTTDLHLIKLSRCWISARVILRGVMIYLSPGC
jgi:hypothetical protein